MEVTKQPLSAGKVCAHCNTKPASLLFSTGTDQEQVLGCCTWDATVGDRRLQNTVRACVCAGAHRLYGNYILSSPSSFAQVPLEERLLLLSKEL